ncbi:hypothetical protein CLV51_1011522 [Chitinophaga niastensis]|uniref:Uncharacterized protein n=1 Tax=Chitinophaga niastensis TaxID=536980 RepID=A0A2P8HVG3_CHINA|nr:hypothetical protein [Chitinophaga niastensis]PSL50178.1 hypothetical protein CLV51_1011522 [Chitinophaga niastensis]
MAWQSGPVVYVGTIGICCFYKLGDKYYLRRKSTLSGKRVKKDPVFRNTMKYAGILATASRMAAAVYRALPKEQKKHVLYRKLTGIAMKMLKAEIAIPTITAVLQAVTCRKPVKKATALDTLNQRPGKNKPGAFNVISNLLYVTSRGELRKHIAQRIPTMVLLE